MAKLCFPTDVWMYCDWCIIADSACVCGNIYLYCSPWLFLLPETVDLVMCCLFTNDEMHVYVVFHVGASGEREPLFCYMSLMHYSRHSSFFLSKTAAMYVKMLNFWRSDILELKPREGEREREKKKKRCWFSMLTHLRKLWDTMQKIMMVFFSFFWFVSGMHHWHNLKFKKKKSFCGHFHQSVDIFISLWTFISFKTECCRSKVLWFPDLLMLLLWLWLWKGVCFVNYNGLSAEGRYKW